MNYLTGPADTQMQCGLPLIGRFFFNLLLTNAEEKTKSPRSKIVRLSIL